MSGCILDIKGLIDGDMHGSKYAIYSSRVELYLCIVVLLTKALIGAGTQSIFSYDSGTPKQTKKTSRDNCQAKKGALFLRGFSFFLILFPVHPVKMSCFAQFTL